MEALDLLWVILNKAFVNENYGKEIIVDYIYNHKVVDAGVYDMVLMYMVSENTQWFGLGANEYYKVARVSVDVRTSDIYRYQKLKEKVLSVFTGQSYSFKPKNTFDAILDEGGAATKIETIGAYVRRVTVVDPTIYAEGEYVQIQYADGRTENGWIVWIYGNYVYVFLKEGQFFLVRPSAINDLSDRMRKLYRFVCDMEVRIVTKVA